MTTQPVATAVANAQPTPNQQAPAQGPNPTGGGSMLKPRNMDGAGIFTFMPITLEAKQNWLKILIYGAAGTGKTTLCGSASNIDDSGDILLVTAEGGDIVFEKNDRIQHPERIIKMQAGRIEQVQKVFEWLSHHCRARDRNDERQLHELQNIAFFGMENKDLAYEHYPPGFERRALKFKTVIIDSLTDIEAKNMAHILGLSDKGFDIGDEASPAGYTEFRKNNNTIQALVRAFRDLPIHLMIICGQKFAQDEQKRYHYTPWLTGQLANQVQSFVDVVGYMVISNADPTKPDTRRLYVQPQAAVRFDAKCRIASFKGAFFENPLFEDILQECGYLKKD